MARQTHHVVHKSSGGWDVKRGGSQRASVHVDTKAEAEKIGRDISRNQKTEFVVHGLDGRIQCSDSHGNDPCPPKDTK
ncbi:hypothetical protein SDC9_197424 [bioreactor metagenome]|uniref:DUF2188 domain-containing protein n=1 Tax=bioreactor metagenome TaxID=1076179 RepID=A0A645IG37_9ZZZZ